MSGIIKEISEGMNKVLKNKKAASKLTEKEKGLVEGLAESLSDDTSKTKVLDELKSSEPGYQVNYKDALGKKEYPNKSNKYQSIKDLEQAQRQAEEKLGFVLVPKKGEQKLLGPGPGGALKTTGGTLVARGETSPTTKLSALKDSSDNIIDVDAVEAVGNQLKLSPARRTQLKDALVDAKSSNPERRRKASLILTGLGVAGTGLYLASDKEASNKEVKPTLSANNNTDSTKSKNLPSPSKDLTQPTKTTSTTGGVTGSPLPKPELESMKERLEIAKKDYMEEYKKAIADAKTEKEKKDTVATFSRLFEKLGLATATYFAAKKGAAIGADVSSGVANLKPSDWQGVFDQNLREFEGAKGTAKDLYEAQYREEKNLYDAMKDSQDKLDSREFTKSENEKDRQARVEAARAAEAAQMRSQKASQDFTASQNRLANESRERISNLRQEAQAEKLEVKENKDKERAAANINGAIDVLASSGDSDSAIRDIGRAASTLGIPEEVVQQITKSATGKGIFTLQDVNKAKTLLKPYLSPAGSTETPAGASSPAPSSPGNIKLIRNNRTGEIWAIQDGKRRLATQEEIREVSGGK